MALDRRLHLYFRSQPAPAPEAAEPAAPERPRHAERDPAARPGRHPLDFPSYRDLANEATQNVRATAIVGHITGRAPGDLKKIQRRLEHHESEGTLRRFMLEHPDDVIALLCANTKRTLSMVISALDSPHDAYLQSLKNLLIADLKPSAQHGEYLDLYNAITELMCASYNYLAACAPQAPASPVTQSDLCKQVRERAERFYSVLSGILTQPEEPAEAARSGVITEATMQLRREERRRLV